MIARLLEFDANIDWDALAEEVRIFRENINEQRQQDNENQHGDNRGKRELHD